MYKAVTDRISTCTQRAGPQMGQVILLCSETVIYQEARHASNTATPLSFKRRITGHREERDEGGKGERARKDEWRGGVGVMGE